MLPQCCSSSSSGPCACCQRWLAWAAAREQQLLQQQQQHGLLDDCCPLEVMDAQQHSHVHQQTRGSRRASEDHNCSMHDDDDHTHSTSTATSCSTTQALSSSETSNCAWPTLGSPFLDACPSTPALSLCVSSSCVPTLNLSQQFLSASPDAPSAATSLDSGVFSLPPAAAAVASVVINPPSIGSFGRGHHSHPSIGSLPHLPVSCPEDQSHFHHHHHSPPVTAAHVHCNQEQALATQDDALRQAHVHTKACNPQVHYQYASDNVYHDHTVPLLDTPTSPDPADSAVKQELGDGAALLATAAAPTQRRTTNTVSGNSNYLPCSRVHPSAFRFHPYAGGANGPSASARIGEGATNPTPAALSAAAVAAANSGTPSSNCHQCKVKKYSATVIQCTAVHEVTVRRSKPMCCVQKKKCAKKYCTTCLAKHYQLQLDQLDRATWVCPGCLGHCNCAACTSKSRAAAGELGMWSQDLQALEMQTTHTHHQHLHTHAHTHTTTYGYGAAAVPTLPPTSAAPTTIGQELDRKLSLQEASVPASVMA